MLGPVCSQSVSKSSVKPGRSAGELTKPSRRLLQSCIAKVCARNSIKMVYIQVRITAVCARA